MKFNQYLFKFDHGYENFARTTLTHIFRPFFLSTSSPIIVWPCHSIKLRDVLETWLMWPWLSEGNLKKTNVSLGHCPKWERSLFHHLLVLVNKTHLFLKQKNNVSIFDLFWGLEGSPFFKSPRASLCSFCLKMSFNQCFARIGGRGWGERSNLGNTQKTNHSFWGTLPQLLFFQFFPARGLPNPLAEFVCLKNGSIEGGRTGNGLEIVFLGQPANQQLPVVSDKKWQI